ncbi:MAG TPA: hypothetical protein DEA91_02495 [Paenibacillus sp.]|nr:hypothetical protein [Paenibacillus sp.]
MGTRITLRIEDITFTTHSEDGMDYGEEMLRLLRIAIVDDEILIREGLARMISKENTEFLVIGTYSDGKHLLDELPSLQLDVVITDIRMPQINGFINWRKSSSSLVTRRYVTVPVSY